MHIKQIIIQGFKSYKDQTVIEPFSPKHNVIVGRNGSGKSNFFSAIRFVLSDAYTQMGREERQALLHEGSGSAVMSAYVEIIFDNSDERFPTGRDELILRRTIGQKKDEYTLDRKNATRSDVMNLLETAGFSRSNPYYIVPQGRVTALTNMKDSERLDLLKEVAGTQVYEARRSESVKIMATTDAQRAKIDELLSYIRERLDELEEEKDELRAYQDKDRERRCLEYTIYHREQEEINKALDQLEVQRNNAVTETDENQDLFVRGEKAMSTIENELNSLKHRLDLLKFEKRQSEDDRRDAVRQRERVNMEIKTINDNMSATLSAKERHDAELKQVQASIGEREAQLAQVAPQYDRIREQESSVKSELDKAEATRQRLYAKQGRGAKFKSKTERDNWLRKEIEDVNIAISTRKAVSMETSEEISRLEKQVKQSEAQIAEIRKTLDGRADSSSSISAEIQKAKEARDRLQDERKELWREESKISSSIGNAQQEMERMERSLSTMMDQNTSRGIAAIRRMKTQQNLQGVYGTLAELFTVPERFRTAVEVTAGNSLFHYVVDNDQTATMLVDALNKEKAGRVTFMPLNRLQPRSANIPQANDAIEMISRLNFEPMYEKALRQVFGKTIICPNLQVAAQYARSHGVNAITPEGDRSDKKGALTGGFHDPRQSRLEAVQSLAKLRTEFESLKATEADVKHKLDQKDQEVTRALSDVRKAEQKRQQAEGSYAPMQQELQGKISDVQTKQDTLESKQKAKANVDANIQALSVEQAAHEAELSSEFKKVLSEAEEKTLEELGSSIATLKKEHLDASTQRSDLEANKSTLEVELRENLRPRLDQLQARDNEERLSSSQSRLKELQNELKRINSTFQTADTQLQRDEESLDAANAEMIELEQRQADQKAQLDEITKAIERQQKRSEKSMAKRALLTEKATEAAKNIHDLGVLPEEAHSKKYTRLPSDQAIKRLHSVNDALKKYSHVNKKAFEQYSNFTRQRETLTKRRTELDKGLASIQELIEHLDQQKDEAIERTFKQVSKGFATIFSKLVPAGQGRLIIQRKSDRDRGIEAEEAAEAEAEAGERRPRDRVENYTGVGISVSFNSKHDDQQRIQQLSGGQKSLCALTLVFAIQQCDPAPFYLFDEIDANLDAQYRTAVAALLEETSEDAQFICTTFRPEMVLVAEKCYGVNYSRKTSSIGVVDREEALEFVEGQVGGLQ